MKKNLIPSFLVWLLAEIIFIVMFAFSGSAVAAVLFFTMLLISLVSYQREKICRCRRNARYKQRFSFYLY